MQIVGQRLWFDAALQFARAQTRIAIYWHWNLPGVSDNP